MLLNPSKGNPGDEPRVARNDTGCPVKSEFQININFSESTFQILQIFYQGADRKCMEVNALSTVLTNASGELGRKHPSLFDGRNPEALCSTLT